MHRLMIFVTACLALGLMARTQAAGAENASSGDDQYTMAQGDPDYDAMPNSPGKDEVFAFCSACHSMKLVSQQHLSRKRWDDLLDWMEEEQGMAPLTEGDRKIVLDYLAEHYGPKKKGGSPKD